MQSKTPTIFLPIFGICMILFLTGLVLWKRLCRYRQPIIPYNPQVAFVTSTYQQQQQQVRSYQPNVPLPSVEQPPSYYAAMNYRMIPSTMSHIKQ